MYKRKNKTFWPAVGLGLLAILALAAGCSQTPTEAPTSTVISGYDSLGVATGDLTDTHHFLSGSTNYGSFWLELVSAIPDPHQVKFCTNYGLKLGTGSVAPDSGYSNELPFDNSLLGQSFFLITDNVPHYGKITITSRRDDAASGYTFIGFQWVVQTVAGKKELY